MGVAVCGLLGLCIRTSIAACSAPAEEAVSLHDEADKEDGPEVIWEVGLCDEMLKMMTEQVERFVDEPDKESAEALEKCKSSVKYAKGDFQALNGDTLSGDEVGPSIREMQDVLRQLRAMELAREMGCGLPSVLPDLVLRSGVVVHSLEKAKLEEVVKQLKASAQTLKRKRQSALSTQVQKVGQDVAQIANGQLGGQALQAALSAAQATCEEVEALTELLVNTAGINDAVAALSLEVARERPDMFARGDQLMLAAVQRWLPDQLGSGVWELHGEVKGFTHENGLYRIQWQSQRQEVNFFVLQPMLTSPPLHKKAGDLGSVSELKEAIESYFMRYDIDGSGLIDSNVECHQLVLNLCFHLGLNLSLQDVEKRLATAGDMDEGRMDFDTFYAWFQDNFSEVFDTRAAPNETTIQKVKKGATRHLVSASIRKSIQK